MVEKGARQSDTRHQTLALIMRVPGVIARSSKSWGFRVKKTLRISWMVCHCIHYHMESSNPRNLRIPLASSLGCASSGSERAFYGQGCYFAELAQHLRVEIIPFEENATTWNQGRRFGLSVNCMSWVWETVWDSTVGLGRYSHLYSYAANGNHQLLLADVLCGNVPWGDQICSCSNDLFGVHNFLSTSNLAITLRCMRWETSNSACEAVWSSMKRWSMPGMGPVCNGITTFEFSNWTTQSHTRTLQGWIELGSGAIVLGCAAIVTWPKTASECARELLLRNFGSDYSYFYP